MKDTPDRPDEPLPVRRSSLPPAAPAAPEPYYYDDPEPAASTPSNKRVSLRLVGRALRRFWWQALLLWLTASGGLVALAYHYIKPTYDAVSQIRVEAFDPEIFAKNASTMDFSQYMQRQVSLITSPPIIANALATNPNLTTSPLLLGATEPDYELKQALRVGVVPRTDLVQVEMSSPVPTEAAQLVNAVVDAYLAHAQATYDASTQKRIDQLKNLRDEQQAEVNKQRKIVADVVKSSDDARVASGKDLDALTIEEFRHWSDELARVQINRIATKSKLDQLRAEKALPARTMDDDAFKAAVVDAFYADPRVDRVEADLKKAQKRLGDVKRIARVPNDPALSRATAHIKELNDEKNELWAKLEPHLRRQLAARPVDDTVEKEIKEAEALLAATITQEEALQAKLNQKKVENRTAQSDGLKLEFARKDLARHEEVLDKINQSLEQLEFAARNPIARVNREFPAKPSNRPNSNRRTQVMAVTPVAVGMFLTAVLVLLELRGARVGDPDELSDRVKLQVIGVVPPLPQIRANGPSAGPPDVTGDLRAKRQLDEFVQSLDHLRVALCARPDPWGRDRHCVLITSACGSEGKTTLAAQLAERCVNAGLITLLVDADLRNPTLSRMLDAPENRGLINVLRGDAAAEDVVMVIGDAGGFHFLPAGTPRVDPSRLLQGDRLGKLLAQARESFDMIIVDAPPVLPVPDALTIGRWTDGAVLAVRYDTSRFPLVERANLRLARVGVPVIGAVVNGVRTIESSYGGYYAYGYGGSTYGGGSNGSGSNGHGDAAPAPPAASPVADD
jgi:capsular exopolysaccharide synthesis family protein